MRFHLLAALGVVASMAAPDVAAQLNPFVEPPVAPDVNPDPDIVEVFLEASETNLQIVDGAQTSVWAFNGTVPGPTIETELGDTLIVHFTNNLPEETTIHWHGIEGPATMDGSHISQLAIPGNGGTFDYVIPMLDAAMFWYHPHVRTNEQVEKGLYGALMVRDPAEDAMLGLPPEHNERIIILDDILLDENNQIVDPLGTDVLENVLTILNGRIGNVKLLNGVPWPIDFQFDNGVPERWRMVNVANAEFFRLSWQGNEDVFQIGVDGGLLEAPILREEIEIVPIDPLPPPGGQGDHTSNSDPEQGIFLTQGERADVVFDPDGTDGQVFRIKAHDWHRGDHIAFFDEETGNILLADDLDDGTEQPLDVGFYTLNGTADDAYFPPNELKTLTKLDPQDSVGKLVLMMGHTPPPLPPDGDVKWFVQMKGPGMPLPFPLVTSLDAYDVLVGEQWTWEVVNMAHMDHPFHTHGFFFQPFEIEVQDDIDPKNNSITPIDVVQWKDTFRVPARPREEPFTSRTILRATTLFDDEGREGLVRAEGQYPTEVDSGGWLMHCHILEHSRNGMMSFFETRYDDQTFWLLGTGIEGTSGVPVFRGTGDLTPNSPLTITLENALPSTPATMFIGLSELAASFKGGTMVPSPDFSVPLVTDGLGEITIDTTWPNGVPSGTELWYQVFQSDAAAVKGVAASNAIKSIAP